jgi:phosphatidylserine/phosphatidylglycerophosphate/cardiolipin synthase-like enzyme
VISDIDTQKENRITILSKYSLFFITLFSAAVFFTSCSNLQIINEKEIELVESIPVETVLGNSDIKKTYDVWLEMINGAKESLDFEQYYISNKKGEPLEDIISAIIKAGERGVKIRFIIDSGMYKTYPETVDSLAKIKNIQCRIIDFKNLAGGIQNAKYFIVDGNEIFLGSQNFDWRALKHIHELGLRIKYNKLVESYENIFEYDWNYAVSNVGKPTFRNENIPLLRYILENDRDTSILIPTASPKNYIPLEENSDELRTLGIIAQAKNEVVLQFLTYSPSDHKDYYWALDSALMKAAERGVKIKMIVSDWNLWHPVIDYLKKLTSHKNIEIKYSSIPDWSGGYIPFARVEHCKYIAADNNSCWIGTGNAEKSYYYNSRNVGMVIKNGPIPGRVIKIFDKDWDGPYTHFIKPDEEYIPREHGEK